MPLRKRQMRINDAIPIVGKLKEDSKAERSARRAKGIVIVPHYNPGCAGIRGPRRIGLLLVSQA